MVNTHLAMNVIMGREWIHTMKGVVSTLHQVMRCQSLDGLYTIDIKRDQSQNQRCYNTENKERGVQRMINNQIERFDKAKTNENEVPEEDSEK